ncbi:MAG: ABC transporter ATP-binding protein [Streptosporangiales bacterium]|nr:ABC transporter ATP-binding protein [Streptosporangiales bacterium]MBO0892551.1 ABC transporter ATP-binding protein [Acidothermales bacterium]
MIEVTDLHAYRGDNYVLQGVQMEIADGRCTTLLGRNGMGKTTLVETIMGLVRPREGRIDVDGTSTVGKEPFEIARRGIGYVPQGRHVFPSLSVEENLTLAARTRGDDGWTLDAVYELFPNLSQRKRNRGSQLSGGEQQMLVIGRALLTNPRLLVMDEPSEGLAPVMVERVGEIVAQLREQGLAIFLVEQNYRLAVSSADKVYVLSKGQVVWEGGPDELEDSDDIRREHLGV